LRDASAAVGGKAPPSQPHAGCSPSKFGARMQVAPFNPALRRSSNWQRAS
jgi:hypothetical protein